MTTPAAIRELVASGPSEEHASELQLYGQFVGDWEFDVTDHAPNGDTARARGEWHFGWVLDGRAIEDVWMVPTRAEQRGLGAGPRRLGITIRVFELATASWRVTWHGALGGPAFSMVGRKEGKEIVQEGRDPEGLVSRWIFSEISSNAFRWRALASPDDGKTWRLEQEMSARRVRKEA
ncbi:MAG TPA: hypothetical protein VIZ68_06070 [Thermoplasmata archaeon]